MDPQPEASSESRITSSTFAEGDPVLLFDDKDRKYLLHLRTEGVFHYHHGSLAHSALIGAGDGSRHVSSNGSPLIAIRPRLVDYVLKMKRGAQVVYPKELGAILMYADIYPGLTVLEAGTGSAALTLALARAVGREGCVVSCEIREDHAAHGRKTIKKAMGGIPDWVDLRVADVMDVIADVFPDRLVLDIPEPWTVIKAAGQHLRPGGVGCFYVPTVPQLEETHKALDESSSFIDVESFELMLRTWNVKGRSVRPDHNMVGHTGFLTVARRIDA
jgi:tRNA (adenine57-N1/adenine58-N1)-methyltransferase